jgi:hypothetical protein
VFRGTWQGKEVAIKALNETADKKVILEIATGSGPISTLKRAR